MEKQQAVDNEPGPTLIYVRQTQIEHRGMFMRACPRLSCLLPCVKKKKAEKMKKSFHIVVVVVVLAEIEHAPQYYMIKQ